MFRIYFIQLVYYCFILLYFSRLINCADNTNHYNQKCVTDNDCGDINGYCDRNRNQCACGDNYSVDLSLNKCVPKTKKLNDYCETDSECNAINGYCSSRTKVCVCKPGSTPIGYNRDQCSVSIRPFDRKKYGERCALFGCDIEQNLRCLYFRCKCVYDYEHKNGECVQKTKSSPQNTNTNTDNSNNKDNNGSVFGIKGNAFIYITIFAVIVIIALCVAFVYAMRNERTPSTAPYYRQNNGNAGGNLYRNTRLRQSGGNSSTNRVINNNFDRIRVANTSSTGNCDQQSVNAEINGGVIATAPQAEAVSLGSSVGESRVCFDASNYGDKPPSYADAIRILK